MLADGDERFVSAGETWRRSWRAGASFRLAGLVLAAAGLCVLAPATAAVANGGGGDAKERLAAKLMKRDPGKRVGGKTQVSTRPGASIVGAPGRINFIIGLGRDQRIVGGRVHDELGAMAGGVSIRAGGGPDMLFGFASGQLLSGGPGNDQLSGGGGPDRLWGGAGNDGLYDGRGETIVAPGPGRNRIDVADGAGDDRVRCVAGAVDRIRADRGDRLNRHCRSARSSVHHPGPDKPAAGAAQLPPMPPATGSGTDTDPYTAPCWVVLSQSRCIVGFAARSLTGFWKNENVPSYKCPASHPYLYNQDYAPGGTTLINGVAIAEPEFPWEIGVSILGVLTEQSLGPAHDYALATGNANSSATNWTSGTATYQVLLVCTNSLAEGWKN